MRSTFWMTAQESEDEIKGRLRCKLAAFELAHAQVHAALLATKDVYCVCGNEFPTGKVARIAYGRVQYADDRCGRCAMEGSTLQCRK